MDSFKGKFAMNSAEQMEQLLEASMVERENIMAAMSLLADIVIEIAKTPENEWLIKYRFTQNSDFVTIGRDSNAEITTENSTIVVKQTSREKAITVKTVFEMEKDGDLVATSTMDSEAAIKCVMKFGRVI